MSGRVRLGPAVDDWLWADRGRVDLASEGSSDAATVVPVRLPRPGAARACGDRVRGPRWAWRAAGGRPWASQSRGWTGAAAGSPQPSTRPIRSASAPPDRDRAVRRSAVRGRLPGGSRWLSAPAPPAAGAACRRPAHRPAPRGARRLDPEQRKSATAWGRWRRRGTKTSRLQALCMRSAPVWERLPAWKAVRPRAAPDSNADRTAALRRAELRTWWP